jgi:hypothetical protein
MSGGTILWVKEAVKSGISEMITAEGPIIPLFNL